MARALITGIGGFVGSHLAEYLLAHTDWTVYGTLRWNESTDNLAVLAPLFNAGDPRVRLVEADLTDAASMTRAVQIAEPDYVFHLAAQSYVQASFVCPTQTLQTNVMGTLNLLEAVREHAPEAWVHNCSSSEVYGRVSPGVEMIDEDHPLSPASPYSISKVGADLLGRFYAEAHGLRVLTTRMFTHTGPRRGDVFAESSFAKQIAMIEAGLLEPSIIKVGNLSAVRTVADVRDAVRAYHTLLTVNPEPGAVYNIGGTHTCTVNDILHELLGAVSFGCMVEFDPGRSRPVDADLQVPDCSRFKAATGWEPEIPFEQTMRDLLEYWRERVKTGVILQR
jgi:GDPmannose 4,6-dehydratase